MRVTALTLIGALGLAATAVSASAAPIVAPVDAGAAPGIVKVWGGCGPGSRPVPGHWSAWRGVWVPPHCTPRRWWREGYTRSWHHRHWAWRDYDRDRY